MHFDLPVHGHAFRAELRCRDEDFWGIADGIRRFHLWLAERGPNFAGALHAALESADLSDSAERLRSVAFERLHNQVLRSLLFPECPDLPEPPPAGDEREFWRRLEALLPRYDHVIGATILPRLTAHPAGRSPAAASAEPRHASSAAPLIPSAEGRQRQRR